MAEDKDPRIITPMPQSLLDAIDNFRFGVRLPSRAEAIRQLVQLGLKAAGDGESIAAKQKDIESAFDILEQAAIGACERNPGLSYNIDRNKPPVHVDFTLQVDDGSFFGSAWFDPSGIIMQYDPLAYVTRVLSGQIERLRSQSKV